jgi:hypothetical protein
VADLRKVADHIRQENTNSTVRKYIRYTVG